MTPNEVRIVLKLIDLRLPYKYPSRFAELLVRHRVRLVCGRGSYQEMGRAGGMVLSSLRKEGWIYIHRNPSMVRLTARGRAKLRELSQ